MEFHFDTKSIAGSVNSVVAIVLLSVVNEFAWAGSVSSSKLAQIIDVKLICRLLE